MKYICNYSSHEEFLNGIPTDKDNIILCRASNMDDWHMHWNCSLFDKRVEYLQNPVGAFIRLPYKPSNNTGYEIKWCKADSQNLERSPLGCWHTWKSVMWGDDFKQQNTQILCCWGNDYKSISTNTYPATNFVIWRRVGTKFYYNGSNVVTNTSYTFQSNNDIFLFGININNISPSYTNTMKITYCKIFDSTTNETFLKTYASRVGYLNETSLNSILPLKFLIFCPP